MGRIRYLFFFYLWRQIKTYNTSITSMSDMIEKVKRGEELPPLDEIRTETEEKPEKEKKKQPTRAKSSESDNVTEKGRSQRFDEVF